MKERLGVTGKNYSLHLEGGGTIYIRARPCEWL